MCTVNVGIDCAPGSPRPDSYIGKVFEKFGVTPSEPISKCFGAWTWEFESTEQTYRDNKVWLKEYMDGLYNSGRIRGAEWGWN